MKKVFLCLTASAFLAILSCNKDDGNDTGLISVENDPTEETVLDVSDVSSNIEINGATRVPGNAPAPNGAITFSIDNTNQSAFQKNGFDIILETPDSYAGAYIQLKGENGVAGEYFDVPAGAGKSSVSKKRGNHTTFISKTQKIVDNEIRIDVDFIDVPPGKFCYLICIYDADGNISDPTEVCVDVEAWGGNPNIVGTWNFEKSIEEGETIAIGAPFCEPSFITCENGEELEIENAYCYTTISLPLTFNADGTYEYRAEEENESIDYTASRESCTAVFEEKEIDLYISKGKWAYDEEEGKLSIVEFQYTDGDFTENIENGELVFDGEATISASNLIIKEVYTEEGVTYSYEIHFKR